MITPQFTSGSGGNSGDNSTDLVNLRTDIIPHSPEAEALGKYGVLPVTLYSGMASVSVPIFEIKSGSIDLPFSLSYNSNGYKPNEMASWVGLGWSVQGGGVITRIVKGLVDESMSTGKHYDDFVRINNMVWNQPFLQQIAQKAIDPEPDVYIFNVGGYSGKFIMIKGQAYLFPHQNIRIEQFGANFKLTDDKGNVYLFNDHETTYQKQLLPGNPVPDHPSAWYVSKIISGDTKDTVNFGYAPYVYRQPNNYVETYSIDGSLASTTNTSGHSFASYAIQGDHIDALLLTSVQSRYGDIFFNPSAIERTDLVNSVDAFALDNITVLAVGGGLSKQLKLNHGYFGGGPWQRLNLQSVDIRQIDPDESSRYSFEYAGATGDLPDPATKSVDLFGYYNGANNAMLFPAGTFSPTLYTYADRSGAPTFSQLCQLSKVTYPTGGYSTFTYEQNQYGFVTYKSQMTTMPFSFAWNHSRTMPDGSTRLWLNLHLDSRQEVQVQYNAFIDNDLGNIKAFNIQRQGSLNPPIFYSSPVGQPYLSDSLLLDAGDYLITMYCPQSATSITGILKYMATVEDQNTLADGPGLRIKKISSFNYDDVPAFTKQYSYSNGGGGNSGGISASTLNKDCSQYTSISFFAALKGPLSEYSDEQFYYQWVQETTQDPTQTGKSEYTYGTTTGYQLDVKPFTQTDFQYKDGAFIPVQKAIHQYYSTVVNEFTATEVLAQSVVGGVCSGCWGCTALNSPDPTQASTVLTVFAPYQFSSMQSTFTVPQHDQHIEYDSVGGVSLQSQTDYYYDNPSHLFPTRIITSNSKNEQTTAWFKYPFDYTLGQTASLNSLNSGFQTDMGTAVNTLSSTMFNEETALQPYQPYAGNTSANQQQFAAIASQYDCKSTFINAVATAITNRNNNRNAWLSSLDGLIASNTVPWQKATLWMQRNNMVSPWIERYVSIKKSDGNEYLISATRNEYNLFTNASSAQTAIVAAVSQTELSNPLLFSSFTANPDTYYKQQVNYGYDQKLNLTFQNKVSGKKLAYRWDYADAYPVAQVVNADIGDIAYTSFETTATGGWITGQGRTQSTGTTGLCYYSLNSDISRTGLNSAKSYIVSYWSRNGSYTIPGTMANYPITGRSVSINGAQWTYYEHKVSGQTTVMLNGIGNIDELRLYPANAQMTTYTYSPAEGITSQCDVNNRITYYEYDALGRLKVLRDQDGNVVKTIEYHYKGQ